MNLAATQSNNNNNNITKIESIRPTIRSISFTSSGTVMPSDEHLITPRNNIWQQTKHRMGSSPPIMGASNISLINSIPTGQPQTIFPINDQHRSTPTSSDQINEYVDRTSESPNRMSIQDRNRKNIIGSGDISKISGRDLKNNGPETTHTTCDNDNDEEVIVTNDENECTKKKLSSIKDQKRNEKNRYYH